MSKQGFYKDLGLRIRAHRTRLGLAQGVLADRMDLARTSLVNIEQGRQYVDAYRLGQLAHIFGVTADELLRGPIPTTVLVERRKPNLWKRLRRAVTA